MNNVVVLDPLVQTPLITEECCGNCKHVRQWPNKDLKCHRNPPQALLFMGKTPDGKMVHGGTMADWPPVKAELSCGEYKRRILVESPQ